MAEILCFHTELILFLKPGDRGQLKKIEGNKAHVKLRNGTFAIQLFLLVNCTVSQMHKHRIIYPFHTMKLKHNSVTVENAVILQKHELFMVFVVRVSVHHLNKFKGLLARTKYSNMENVKLLIHSKP